MTLAELLVTMVLIGVVSTLVVGATTSASQVFLHTEDENQGLRDAKVVLDRLGRDAREARSVYCDQGPADPTDPTAGNDTTCRAHLQLWIDDDMDFAQDDDEIVTWQLRRSVDGEHYDVWRVKGLDPASSTEQRQATSLIVQTLFSYDTADPEDAHFVRITMRYDALVGIGVDMREASVSIRLRNKG